MTKAQRPSTPKRTRKGVLSNAELKENERLIKSRFYSWALETHAGGWDHCSDDVKRKTGVWIPVETLRQNFRPTNAKRGRRERSFRKLEYLRAIYDFIRAVGYCNAYTLASAEDGMDAALALGAYIGATGKSVSLGSSFRSEVRQTDTSEIFELDSVTGKKGGVARVLITETIEESKSEVPLKVLYRQGWTIGNDAGMILMFTRHEYEGAELFLVLHASPVQGTGTPPDKLTVFRYHAASRAPLLLAPSSNLAAQLGGLTPGKLLERSTLHLTRVGKHGDLEVSVPSRKRHFAPLGGKDWQRVTAPNDSIDQEFLALVKAHDYDRAIALIPLVSDINVRDPKTGATALHLAAAVSARKLIVELEKRPDLDFGARDSKGFRASDRAWVDGRNQQLGMELADKEVAQAQARGLMPEGPSKA